MRSTRRWVMVSWSISLALTLGSCGLQGGANQAPAPRDAARDEVARAGSHAVVIAAAGDIASQGAPSDANIDTANVIAELDPDAVLTLGDNQYEDGELADYRDSYDLTWGRFKNITHPTPGNHDYHVAGAQGYFDYFGVAADPPDGYYSFNLGRWHLVAVNSGDGSISEDQLAWLRRDLRSDRHLCELAYWHHPRWSSGDHHGSDPDMGAVWRLMVRNGVDVVLNGHDHVYERFGKLGGSGQPARDGVREFIAGTGGESLYGFDGAVTGSRVRIAQYGVLEMVLKKRGYAWKFLRASNGGVLDEGSTGCHR